MQRLGRLLAVLLSIVYPFAVFWGLHSGALTVMLVFLTALLLLRLITVDSSAQRLVTGIMIAIVLLIFWRFGAVSTLKFYPVVISLSLLAVFAGSLLRGMPVVERMARMKAADLPPAAVRYTRQVTIAWCWFFVVNGLIALWTVLQASDELWLLYNGVIAYLLIGTMFAGEWCIRKRMMERSQ